ncbi:MAG TPA: PEP/pyruvate-binding domain-containing protein [Rubrobacteraceae bacterium]|nr:PEP/pyruvate-binding domain-containing protein [Rubrobacteraceae bacterium]
MTYTVYFDEVRKEDVARAGGKGANLGELSRAGLPVPPGFVITTAAYDAFVETGGLREEIIGLASRAKDPAAFETTAERIHTLFARTGIPDDVASGIQAAYATLGGDGEIPVAVRSSATAEDLPGASFAGQQETYLNVRGAAALLEAVKDCWTSLWTARAMSYRENQGIDPASVSLAVVVQRMVEAEAAGILFTADPVSGRRDRTVISAAWGLGEAVVGGRVTPDTLVVDKTSERIISRETTDKEVMTVYVEGGTEEKPVPEARRMRPVLDDKGAVELARYGARIEKLYGAPQDIEWALASGEFFILQARPITALPEVRPPTDWTVPDPKGFYSRGSIVELLPDPLTPLFASLAPEPVGQTIKRIGYELLDADIFTEMEISLATINGYAYYYMRLTPRATWQILRMVPGALRQMIVRQAGERLWRERFRPRYARAVQEWEAKPPGDLSATELLTGVKELLYRGAQYYTSVQMIMPSAYTSEALFAAFYDRLIRDEGDPPSQTFLLGFDSVPIRAEKELYDLATWCRARPALAAALMDTPSVEVLETERPPADVDEALWREWRSRFWEHLDRYGRMVYDLDFAKPVPADDPAPTLDTLKYYLRGEGKDPSERQRAAAARREEVTTATMARLDAPRRRAFRSLLRWTQRYVPLREDALADVGLAWPLMRRMLFELGRRLAAAGAIERPDDVFWLEGDELRAAAEALDAGRTELESLSGAVGERKSEWRAQRLATPPPLLPKGVRFLGVDWQRWMPARSEEPAGGVIEGVGASSGRITARARVLRGPEDFGEMRPGEVLVAGITTPAWTPLFALASAVVTDVGGPLSHGSIVAREYGIPAVLGTGVATRRIRSGHTVRVDGDAGTVTLLDGASEASAVQPSPESGSRERNLPSTKTVVLLALAGIALALWWRRRGRS